LNRRSNLPKRTWRTVAWREGTNTKKLRSRFAPLARTANAGSRLKPLITQEGTAWKPAFQPYWGKPAVSRWEKRGRGESE
jgi:hypothetical protein